MTKLITGAFVAVGLFVLLGLAPQNSMQASIQQLNQELADLGLRVDRLEHATGSVTQSSTGQDGTPPRVMTMVAVSQSDHSVNNADQIAQLQRQNASLMNAVNQVSVDQAQAAGQDLYAGRSSAGEAGWGQASGSTVVSTNIGAAGRQVIADQDLKERYSTLAYIQREKLKKLQAANSVPKQIIHGHDAHTIYTLETETDLSGQLNNIAIGDTVTWTGTRQDADAQSETWIITSISKVPQ